MKWTIPDNLTYNGRWVSNWFSNMLPMDKPIVYQGVVYRTVEHFYQAMKLPTERIDLRAQIAAMEPHAAKRAIRDVVRFKWREDWDKAISLEVMYSGLQRKFTKDSSWGIKLLVTEGDIVEWNNWGDIFWGADVKTGEGENHLGVMLMKIRETIKS